MKKPNFSILFFFIVQNEKILKYKMSYKTSYNILWEDTFNSLSSLKSDKYGAGYSSMDQVIFLKNWVKQIRSFLVNCV